MFFGVKRERELFVLSEGLVKMSDDVFRGMHLKKNHFALGSKKNKTRKKSKISLSSLCFLSSFLFSLFSLFSRSFPHNKNFFPFSVALVFILSARRTSHLSEHSLERTHHRARKRDILLSVVLCSFNTTIKSVLREKRERRERVVCGYTLRASF